MTSPEIGSWRLVVGLIIRTRPKKVGASLEQVKEDVGVVSATEATT